MTSWIDSGDFTRAQDGTIIVHSWDRLRAYVDDLAKRGFFKEAVTLILQATTIKPQQ